MSAVSAVRATKYHEINWFSVEGILLCPLKPLVTFSICSRSVQLWHLNFPGWLSPTHALSTLVSIGDPWGKGLEVDKWWDFASLSCQPNFPQPTEMGVRHYKQDVFFVIIYQLSGWMLTVLTKQNLPPPLYCPFEWGLVLPCAGRRESCPPFWLFRFKSCSFRT